jgi:cobalt-zinc-cadmium resistance protein CzcA
MFRPMAITVCAALLGSLLSALTVIPTLATFAFRKGAKHKEEHWFASVRTSYQRLLTFCMEKRAATLVVATYC